MYRKSMCEACGMLFAWNENGPRGFWMKNTFMPLDVLFISHDGTVSEIKQGAPMTLQSGLTSDSAQYVIELNQGFCRKHGIKPGLKVTVPDITGFSFVAQDHHTMFGRVDGWGTAEMNELADQNQKKGLRDAVARAAQALREDG
uniref:DUF192 domain-containing protein n=1 Tax=Oxyrrhis marina TaxID=2969 RepID=A0A7S3UNF3_OXYMA|mmetsp:Transcript_80687/g.215392  ORF Transcript_80687/g.215392 Transcript_80687/m.215392 type:complete len:144 (-) Transcript_80687:733-1164(-)